MKTIKMPGHEYAQCCIHEFRKKYGDTNNRDVLQSYATDVLIVDYDTGWMFCNGLYSRTTIKHIGWFMRMKTMNYYIAKDCYIEGKAYNIYTGVCEPIEEHKELVV